MSSVLLIAIFGIGAVLTWGAGVRLSAATDALDHRYGLGEDIGGMVLLAVAGTLPEIAITVPAALGGHVGLAAGNLIGGVAVQTMVLVVCDVAVRGERPLTYLVGSLMPVLEALLVLLVMAGVLMGGLLPPRIALGPVSPASLAIVALWLGGIGVLHRQGSSPRWETTAPGSRPGRHRWRRRRAMPAAADQAPPAPATVAHGAPRHALTEFLLASGVTLAAGVALELTGSTLASRAGIDGVVFGATILSLASALPEISSGVAAVRSGDHRLAVGDIFGGNAFQVCLFLVADLLAGRAVLPAAGEANAWLAILGMALTTVYAGGVIVRSPVRILRMGADSILAVTIFVLGIGGLLAITRS